MELRLLKYFLAVAREQNMTKAAEILHITQPTLSRQIAQLEEELGIVIFERNTRKLLLTSKGMFLRRRAEEIVALVTKTEKELLEKDDILEGRISISTGGPCLHLIADIIKAFRNHYPQVTFDVLNTDADMSKERLENGLLDIAILLEPVNMDRLEFIRMPEKLYWGCFFPASSSLANKKYITANDLSDKPLIIPPRKILHGELRSWFGDSFDRLNICFTSNMTSNGGIMVQKELGYAIAIMNSLPSINEDILCARPFYPELTTSAVLAWKKHQPLNHALQKFIAFTKDYLNL